MQTLHNMLERALISLQARVIVVYYVGQIIYHNDHNDNVFLLVARHDESPGLIYYCVICVDLILKDLHVSLQFLLTVRPSFILHSEETTKMAAWLSLVVNKACTSLGYQ